MKKVELMLGDKPSKQINMSITDSSVHIDIKTTLGSYSEAIQCSPVNVENTLVTFSLEDLMASVIGLNTEEVKFTWIGSSVIVSQETMQPNTQWFIRYILQPIAVNVTTIDDGDFNDEEVI
jgi:hypothetical protein